MWIRHTEMTVMKEGVYTHKSLGTGGIAQYVSHLGKLQGPSAGRSEGIKHGQKPLLWFSWEGMGEAW